MNTFNLVEYQQKAKDMLCPQKLFRLWEEVCLYYDREEIGPYELEEMKEIIWPTLLALASLRKIVDGHDDKPQRNVRRRRA
jgi:hypothetical protein